MTPIPGAGIGWPCLKHRLRVREDWLPRMKLAAMTLRKKVSGGQASMRDGSCQWDCLQLWEQKAPLQRLNRRGYLLQSQELQGWNSSSRVPLRFSCLLAPKSLACRPLSPGQLSHGLTAPGVLFLLRQEGEGRGKRHSCNEMFDPERQTRNLPLYLSG